VWASHEVILRYEASFFEDCISPTSQVCAVIAASAWNPGIRLVLRVTDRPNNVVMYRAAAVPDENRIGWLLLPSNSLRRALEIPGISRYGRRSLEDDLWLRRPPAPWWVRPIWNEEVLRHEVMGILHGCWAPPGLRSASPTAEIWDCAAAYWGAVDDPADTAAMTLATNYAFHPDDILNGPV
jgi:hypothetical protein